MAKYLLLIGLFLFTGVLHAQGCPEGYEPIVGQGFTGCAPRPDNDRYNQPQQPQQQAPQAPPEQWKSQWGAIATDASKGIIGSTVNAFGRVDATLMALKDCRAKGGTQCKFQLAYDNECAVMILGDKTFNVSAGPTIDEATKSGMKICNAASGNCHVHYSACSLPVRIQ